MLPTKKSTNLTRKNEKITRPSFWSERLATVNVARLRSEIFNFKNSKKRKRMWWIFPTGKPLPCVISSYMIYLILSEARLFFAHFAAALHARLHRNRFINNSQSIGRKYLATNGEIDKLTAVWTGQPTAAVTGLGSNLTEMSFFHLVNKLFNSFQVAPLKLLSLYQFKLVHMMVV